MGKSQSPFWAGVARHKAPMYGAMEHWTHEQVQAWEAHYAELEVLAQGLRKLLGVRSKTGRNALVISGGGLSQEGVKSGAELPYGMFSIYMTEAKAREFLAKYSS